MRRRRRRFQPTSKYAHCPCKKGHEPLSWNGLPYHKITEVVYECGIERLGMPRDILRYHWRGPAP